jgi:probable HAF family extracellular repeat protein
VYQVTDLAPSAVLDTSRAFGINASGMVVGDEAGGVGFVWTPSAPNVTTGARQLLPSDISPALRPVATSNPQAINASGVIVGECATVDMNGNNVTRAFIASPGSLSLGDLGTFVPDQNHPGHWLGNSAALGLNDAGDVVGWAEDVNGTRRAFLLRAGSSQMQDLSASHALSLPSGTADPSRAAGINNAGTIVGTATFVDAAGAIVEQAFVTQVGSSSLVSLGTLLPNPLGNGFFGNSTAQGLNNTGVVVGDGDALPAGLTTLTLGIVFSNPSVPIGPNPSLARAVNRGQFNDKVVGHFVSNASTGATSGFIADLVSGVVDLNSRLATSGWRIDDAMGINDLGQICGIGTHATLGGPRAVLLTP